MATRNVLEAYGSDLVGAHVQVGGGGHTIQNQSGTDLTQRNTLQFTDSHVSDDSANGRTVVENVKEVTLAELSQATERGMYLATDEESVPIPPTEEDVVSVTADGVKTYGELFNEIFSQIDSDKITENTKLVLENNVLSLSWKQSTEYDFYSIVNITASNIVEMYASLRASSTYFSATNGTPSQRTSQKPANGTVITLHYGTSSGIIELNTDARHCQYDENTTVKQKIDEQLAPNAMSNIDLINYTVASGDKFTLPANGYIWGNMSGSSSSGTIQVYSKDGQTYTYFNVPAYTVNMVYGLKGMKVCHKDCVGFRFIKFD